MKGHEDLARVEELKYLGHGPVAATSFWQMTNKGRDKGDQNGQNQWKKGHFGSLLCRDTFSYLTE